MLAVVEALAYVPTYSEFGLSLFWFLVSTENILPGEPFP